MHPTSLQFTALSNGLRADVARVYIYTRAPELSSQNTG